MQYKAFITDLDGTAVAIGSNGNDISDSLIEIIRNAQEKGYIIGCATGRRSQLALPVIHALRLTDPCIIEGGSCIIDPQTREVLWSRYLEDEVVTQLIHEVTHYLPKAQIATATIHKQQISLVQNIPAGNKFLYVLGVTTSAAEEFKHHIMQAGLPISAHLTPSWSGPDLYDIHITHRDATKETALKAWCDLLKLESTSVVAIGDSDNDIPLFNAAGHTIAPAHATRQLLAVADQVAPEAASNPLAWALQMYVR